MRVASVLAVEAMSRNCDFSHCIAKFIAASCSPFSGASGQYKKRMCQPVSWVTMVCACEKAITKEVVRT